MNKIKHFSDLLGHTITAIDQSDSDFIQFSLADGTVCQLYHEQDCCESVSIEGIDGGKLQDLIGDPITVATEDQNHNDGDKPGKYSDSWTWTTFTLGTAKATIVIRWLGESNGYYSEDVNLYVKHPGDDRAKRTY
jgi:hypothetical protein